MPRPRLQFALRTLLIVVAVASVLLGYIFHEISVVRQRAEVLKTFGLLAVWGVGTTEYRRGDAKHGVMIRLNDNELSFVRRALGDHYVTSTKITPRYESADPQRLAELFPEASVDGHWDGRR